jgi:TolA-binding protein
MKETDGFRFFTLTMLTGLVAGLAFMFNTLSAQNSAIEHRLEQKFERIEAQSVPRQEWQQLEKRLEAMHQDIREIRRSQQ